MNLTFRHPWRTYQFRILGRLPSYRADRRIHIVAPPGAGKTVLGLEIAYRLGGPALVLSPSLTIQAQWRERLLTDFGASVTDVSTDLTTPAAVTTITYQALYAYHREHGTEGLDGFATLVVDECHHLRREWWRVLDAMYQRYTPELVALTATPPYDVGGAEWRRYHSFCGEVDEEITIPELIASGDLCPHQDYLYPILLPPEAAARIADRQEQQKQLLELAHTRGELTQALRDHPCLQAPEEHYEAIFEHPEYFTSLLSLLAAQGGTPPAAALGVLHGEATLAPALSDRWLDVFLSRALREDAYFASDFHQSLLKPYRRYRSLAKARPGELIHAPSQLEAVAAIVDHEHASLADQLRLVVLTDHVHAEFLPTTEHDRRPLGHLGTVPVFEVLRRREHDDYRDKLCLLTGSLVILPATAVARLLDLAYTELPIERVISTPPLFEGAAFVKVDAGTLESKYLVRWVTQLFTEGHLQVIVGTAALLGQGWDAPAVNTLVLANRVGSFVLSNQMRGRALRTLPGRPDKTANIWHPVVIHPDLPGGGPELDRLRRRFQAFVGPRLEGHAALENGLSRLGIYDTMAADDYLALRRRHLHHAGTRPLLIERWHQALRSGQQLIEAIQPAGIATFATEDELTAYTYDRARKLQDERQATRWQTGLGAVGGSGMVAATTLAGAAGALTIGLAGLTLLAVAYALYIHHRQTMAGRGLLQQHHMLGQPDNRLTAYATALLRAMQHAELLGGGARVQASTDEQRQPYIYLTDADRHDHHRFAEAMAELLSPSDNPRYLLHLQADPDWPYGDYYLAVPSILGRRAPADRLAWELGTKLGVTFRAIYTREPAGRLHLLRARLARAEGQEAVRELIWS